MESVIDKIVYVGYGIGCYYSSVCKEVKEKIELSYLCDKKWDKHDVVSYDNIPIISQKELAKIENVKVIIFPSDNVIKSSIANELSELGIEYIFVDELLGRRSLIGKIIKEEGKDGIWKDVSNNVIFFDNSLPDEVTVFLCGANNCVRFGKNLLVNELILILGNGGSCEIGENTRILEANIFVAHASVIIGKDCLFSEGVTIRTHDGHHIFDRNTHKRINHTKNVVIQDHVWLGEGVCLLPGTIIGEGSIVGAKTITSNQFEDHVIIAGIPGKVIRRQVCWSKDSTDYMNYSYLEECVSKDALIYSV